jgi:hypothetical protein
VLPELGKAAGFCLAEVETTVHLFLGQSPYTLFRSPPKIRPIPSIRLIAEWLARHPEAGIARQQV